MEKIILIIQDAVEQAFNIKIDIQLTRPDEKFGDYATNVALQLAQQIGQNPREIAEKIVGELRNRSEFSEVSLAGAGFINIRLKAAQLAAYLQNSWSPQYGCNDDGKNKTAIVEFPSQNMAKPYSVGHLRPGNQGWAVKKLMEASGWRVITDNHLGDYGAPFGIWVTGFLKFSSDEKLAQSGVYELGRIYIETKKALKDEAEQGGTVLADEVQNWLLKLENGDEQAVDFSNRFKEISLKHIHEIMSRLKISTDYELGESFYVEQGKKAVQDLLAKNIAVQNDDGSVIVPLSDVGCKTPLLIQKSNGAALYATTDLATLIYREKKWHPDCVVYAVGAEQQFYFQQLFALAKKLGIKTNLIHLWFGLIEQLSPDGKREKMSSRKGVVLMEELLDQAEQKAREIVGNRQVSDEDIKKIALGAIKFNDFVADRRTNILFNWDSIFALSGFSGPYVQYATVRVNKILQDNNNDTTGLQDYDYEPEKKLIIKILEYPEVVKQATRDFEPHKVANYLYNLARELNRYYENTPISIGEVTDTQRQARLWLLTKISYILTHGLDLLGIEVPERM